MADNAVQSLSISMQVATYIEDATEPTLTGATFDFNGGLLSLFFSETVNASTFDPTQITFQGDPISLSLLRVLDIEGGQSTTDNSISIVLTLTDYDLNRLKDIPALFTSLSESYISITNLTIQDMNGNYIIPRLPDNPLILDQLIPDMVSPEILGFDLDMNIGKLIIRFSETIDTSQFNVDQLWIQNGRFNSSEQLRLIQPPQREVTWNLTHVEIILVPDDVNAIKLLQNLATSNTDTYLRFTNTTALDNAGNGLSILNETEGIPVTVYTLDSTPPRLVSFDLDMDGTVLEVNGGPSLTLSFSEPVMAASVVFESITIQSTANVFENGTEYHTFMNGTITNENGLEISFDLTFIDYVTIQSLRSLAIDTTSTYISLETGAVLDMNFNPSVNISEARLISVYTADTTPPSLREFSIDLDSGLLALTFSEAMDSMSVAAGTYILINAPTAADPGENSIRFDSILDVSSLDWYIINITLNFEQLNRLKIQAENGVYISNTTSYLALQAILPVDTANQRLDPPRSAVPISEYIPDTTIPILDRFHFDASGVNGIVTLEFSEPVDISSLVLTLIEFHNSLFNSSSSTVVPITGGSVNTINSGLSVQFKLSQDNFNLLKTMTEIATDESDTFIFLKSGAVSDMYGNAVSDVGGLTLQVYEVLRDSTNPELDSFSFDLDSGTLYLTFSETVNSSTLNTSEIMLQSDITSPQVSFRLTGGEASLLNEPVIRVSLTIDDLNSIKELRGLATSPDNTFISVTSGAILDMVGLNLTVVPPNMAIRVGIDDFTPDITSPILLSFSLDLTSEELSLTFDETISYMDTDLRLFTLQSEENGTSVILTTSSIVSPNNFTEIVITLSTFDLNRIKLDTSLATELGNTQIVLGTGAVRDMAGVRNELQILDADMFFPDLVSPSLESYVFDLNIGMIRLNFDETINADSLNIEGLSFMERPNGSIIFNLRTVFTNSTNGTRLDLYIADSDLNAIKENTSLLTSMSDAYLALLPIFLTDMNQNPLNEVRGVQAAVFVNDTSRPSLVRFDLDMDLAQLRLVFSETVNASSFDPTGITLQLEMNSRSADTRYTLMGGYLLNEVDSTELVVVFNNDDLNIIKARGIAQNNDTTYLVLSEFTVRDLSTFTLPNVPVTNGPGAENVDVYTPDQTSPILLNFTLNLTSETLDLTFDETVDAISINTTQFTLQNTSGEPLLEFFTLTSASSTNSVTGPVINIQIDSSDLNAIKSLSNLATNTENTFLSFTELAASDVVSNLIVPRPTTDALQAQAVFGDEVRPNLLRYTLSLNEGILTLTFSETVRARSVVVTDLSLQNQPSLSVDNETSAYNLTGGMVLSEDGPIISVSLSQFDLNEIKLISTLASGANNVTLDTYLTLRSSGATDSNGNIVMEISASDALLVSAYFSDITQPQLEDFNFDLNTGIITLIFDEAVNGATLDPEGVTLHNASQSNTTSYTLTNGSVVLIRQTSIGVQLTDYDLNNIKAIGNLATGDDDTFVMMEDGSILDNDNNPVVGLLIGEAISVTNLTRDSIPPQLRGFDLDIDSGNLTLTFSETVLAYTLQASAFTLQNSASLNLLPQNSSKFFTLVNSENVTSVNNLVLVLEITNSDLNEIKKRSRLATARENTFLSLSAGGARDASGNSVDMVPSTNSTSVTNYTADESPPELMSFNVDLNRGEITFRFSETINATTLQQDSFMLQDTCPFLTFSAIFNGSNSTETNSYTLTGN